MALETLPLLKTLDSFEKKEMLVYCDSGDILAKDSIDFAENFLEKQDCLFVEGVNKRGPLIKRDCLQLMGCTDSLYTESFEVYASIIFLRKTEKTINLIKEWLEYCKNINVLTDVPNITGPEREEVWDHRHDQAVLGNLVLKYDLPRAKELCSDPWILGDVVNAIV